jgi:DNA replication and repair protein RecF
VRITRLELRDFRNCEHRVLEPSATLTVLVGPNAAGKTNIIEAVSVVASGSSFRRAHWDEVVRSGATEAAVQMSAEGNGSHTEVQVRIHADGHRDWLLNGVHKRRASECTRFVPVVSFTPDDLLLAKGSAELRRGMLDALGEQLSVTYGALRRDYARVVRQRNSLLREGASPVEIAPWDEQLAGLGARVHTHRRGLARRVLAAARPIYEQLAGGETLSARMVERCGLGSDDITLDIDRATVEEAIRSELARRREEERARGVSLVGPHRDDLVYEVDGRDARAYASQGQQRTIALAWKLAEVSVVLDVLGRLPVLLLDDVMSELDEARRSALTDLVQRDTQTFVTTTSTGYFDPDLIRSAMVVRIGGESG